MNEARTHYEQLLAATYLRAFDVNGPVELFRYQFGDWFVQVGAIELPALTGDSFWAFVTFGGTSNKAGSATHIHQFVSIADVKSPAVGELVASASHYDALVARIGLGDTVPLGEGSALRVAGYRYFIVLSADIYRPLERLELYRLPVSTSVFAVVPISEAEFAVKIRTGVDGLLESWDSAGRNILSVTLPVQ